jgi:hypothetical protein
MLHSTETYFKIIYLDFESARKLHQIINIMIVLLTTRVKNRLQVQRIGPQHPVCI